MSDARVTLSEEKGRWVFRIMGWDGHDFEAWTDTEGEAWEKVREVERIVGVEIEPLLREGA